VSTKIAFAALKAIHAQPDAARASGLVEGRDVIDALLLRAARLSSHDSEWIAVAAALSVFRDKRVAAFFVEVLETATRADLLFSAARYLGADAAVLRDRLRPLLLQDGCVARARAVASLFVAASSSDPAERLRVALAADAAEPPPLDDGCVRLACVSRLAASGRWARAPIRDTRARWRIRRRAPGRGRSIPCRAARARRRRRCVRAHRHRS
jgi:hypothetical protein